MKSLILLVVVTLVYSTSIQQSETISARGYNRRVAIPLGDEIRGQEESILNQGATARITGGSNSDLGQFPYHAGVLTNFNEINGTGVCGGSLVSSNKVIHAAHCWFDGENQGYVSEIVLGTKMLFFGGTRQSTSNVIMHPQWNPDLIRDDVAVISLSNPIQFSNIIAPIALPSGSQLNELFVDEVAVATGFGRTSDSDAEAFTLYQTLSHVNQNIITNAICRNYYPNNVIDSHICTSGSGGISSCSGDSGGPLAVTREEKPVLIGVTSFGSFWGCQLGLPTVFARVSYFISFFNQHL